MTRKRLVLWFLLVLLCHAAALAGKTENVILVTYDGLRWQEVFSGADPLLLNKETGGVQLTNQVRTAFWRETAEARREVLLPFLWNVVAKQGQILGNKNRGSIAKVGNGLNFSYPGYNELLAGFADPAIDSNEKGPNPNRTVLEWLNDKSKYRGRVAAFCSWSVFADILNRDRSGLMVKAGREMMFEGKLTPRQELLNNLVRDTAPPWEYVLNDSLTYHCAEDYLRTHKPRVLYIAFDETDDWAHDKRYDRTLEAAQRIDRYLSQVWKLVQSMRNYRGKTTLIVTTDHGRGEAPSAWKNHGKDTAGAEYIWMAFLGPDIAPLGERGKTETVTQSQIAATLAAFLGEDYRAAVPKAAPAIQAVIARTYIP